MERFLFRECLISEKPGGPCWSSLHLLWRHMVHRAERTEVCVFSVSLSGLPYSHVTSLRPVPVSSGDTCIGTFRSHFILNHSWNSRLFSVCGFNSCLSPPFNVPKGELEWRTGPPKVPKVVEKQTVAL